MGSGRSRHRCAPLSAMQLDPARVSATPSQISHPGAREHTFRPQGFPEGILLPGLSFHLDEPAGTSALPVLESLFFRPGERGLNLTLPARRPCASSSSSSSSPFSLHPLWIKKKRKGKRKSWLDEMDLRFSARGADFWRRSAL